MAFKDLFKTKAEREAYARGRKDQYNKEHPKLRWGVQSIHYSFNEDGTLYGTPYTTMNESAKFKTKKQALSVLNDAEKSMLRRKNRVLDAVKKKKVDIYQSVDSSYTDYKFVKINERKK